MKIKRSVILLTKLVCLAFILGILFSIHSKSFAAPNPYGGGDPFGTGIPPDVASVITTYAGDNCGAWPGGPFEGGSVQTWISPAGEPGQDFSAQQVTPNTSVALQINTLLYVCPNQGYTNFFNPAVTYGGGYIPPDGTENTNVSSLFAITWQFNTLTTNGGSISGFSSGTQVSTANTNTSVYWFGAPVPFTYTAPSTQGTYQITESGPVVNIFGNPTTYDCDAQVGNPPMVVATTPTTWTTQCGWITASYTVNVAQYTNVPSLTNSPGGGSASNPTTIQRPTTTNVSASTITFAVGMNNNGNAWGPTTYLEFINPSTSNFISPGISATTTSSFIGEPYNNGNYGYNDGNMEDGEGVNWHYYFGRTADPPYGQNDWSVQYQGVQYQVAYRAPGGTFCFHSAVTPSTPTIATAFTNGGNDCFNIPPPTDTHTPTVTAAPSCLTSNVSGTADDADWPTSNPGYSQAPITVDYTIDGGPTESVTTGSTSDSYSIPMNMYNGAAIDQLLGHTVSITVPDVNSIGNPGGLAAATTTVTYPPCYAPSCGSDILTVAGDANSSQDGPSPGQTFTTTAIVSFNPKSGQAGNSGANEASGTYSPPYGNIYQDFQSLPSPQNGGNTGTFAYTWVNGVPVPGTYTYDFGYNDSTASIGPCTFTVIIGFHPFVSVTGGDVLSGSGGYSTSVTPGQSCSQSSSSAVSGAGILAFNNGQPTTSNNGAGTDLASYAPNIINEFVSSSGVSPPGYNPFTNNAPGIPNGLVFANTYANQPTSPDPFDTAYGGGFGSTVPASCASDYYDSHPATAYTVGSVNVNTLLTNPGSANCTQTTDASSVATTTCFLTSSAGGDVNITGGTNLTGKTIIYVQGDALITGNITFDNGPWATVDNIPSLYIVTNSNMYIDSGVNTLSGVYVAQPPAASSNEGNIFTCTSGHTMFSASQLFDNCGADTTGPPLTINGAFVANQVRFERTYGSVDQGSNASTTTTTTVVPDFASGGWQLNGSAYFTGPGNSQLNLTPVQQDQVGSAFYKTPIAMTSGTSLTVKYSETMENGNGADGTSLILAGSPTSLGGVGCSDGVGGMNSAGNPVVGVSLDGYENWPAGDTGDGNNNNFPSQDPSSDFVGITEGGSIPFTNIGAGSCLNNWIYTKDLTSSFALQGQTVNVTAVITKTTISVTLNQGATTVTLPTQTVNEQPTVYIGFGGSTGGDTDDHLVSSVSVTNQTTTTTTTNTVVDPAEQFNYGPMTWLSEPSTAGGILPANPNYDSITALSPVL